MARLTEAERTRYFGVPCTQSNFVLVTLPWGMRVQCHRVVENVLITAANEAARSTKWRPLRADSFACRKTRGASSWSLHAFGLAWDFFATPPGMAPPGGVWTPDNGVPAGFAQPFEDRGFTWGAKFSRVDVPHIEWAGPPPGLVHAASESQGDYVVPQPPPPPVQLPGGKMRQLVTVGPLDASGKGWAQTSVPFAGFEAATVNAVNPEQSGYGPAVVVHAMNWDEKVRLVVMGGRQGDAVGVYVTTAP